MHIAISVLIVVSIVKTIISVKSANNHFKKFLSASACLPFSIPRISAESIA